MVFPREQLLGAITELDEDGSGTVTCNDGIVQDVSGYQGTAQGTQPVVGSSGIGIFWVENPGGGNPTLPKFTDSDNVTITLGTGSVSLVDSVFGRTGAVVAANGDYNSGQITNNSSISGSTVTNALNNLASTGTNKLNQSDGAGGWDDTGFTISGASDTTISSTSNVVFGSSAASATITAATSLSLLGASGATLNSASGNVTVSSTTGQLTCSSLGQLTVSSSGGQLVLDGASILLNGGTDNLIWPAADGAAGYVMTTDGAGNLSFEEPVVASISIESIITTSSTIADATEAGHRLFPVTVSSADVTVTLPATPIDGESITIKHWSGDATAYNIIISDNGNNIDGTSGDDYISNNQDAFTYQYSSTLSSWVLR